ncbi:MAG: acyl-CoA dehydratase activase-related protein [Limnochordia bacterium]
MAIRNLPSTTNECPSADFTAARPLRVGLVEAFTGHYKAVRVLRRFLELMGMDIVRSKRTTPEIMAAGTTLASADLCLPVRVYVGHVYQLLRTEPHLTHLIAPNVLSEDGRCSTCCKYRDIGGVALRTLGNSTSYYAHRDVKLRKQIRQWVTALTSAAEVRSLLALRPFPTLITPNIHSLSRLEMRRTCYNVYADLRGWSPKRKIVFFLPRALRNMLMPELARLEKTAAQAYEEVVEKPHHVEQAVFKMQEKPMLAVAGRPYMVHDPALTGDLVHWFQRRGVTVITAKDVPPQELRRDAVKGFYDSHKEEEALVRWAAGRADGVICVGSFGCHPDAFQLEYLTGVAQQLGLPCWALRFDETTGSTGLITRYETILAFLTQRARLRRQKRRQPTPLPVANSAIYVGGAGSTSEKRLPHGRIPPREDGAVPGRIPLLTWPYMGEVLNLCLEECAWQLGLSDYITPPAPVTEQTMLLGNDRYTQSCSPFALSTGSLRLSLTRIAEQLEREAKQGRGQPRRVIMLMLHGEGPCTFGWYSLAQRLHLPQEFAGRYAQGGHTVEMLTAGMDGLGDLARRLCAGAGRTERLIALIECMERLGRRRPVALQPLTTLRLMLTLGHVARPVFAKLDAVERLRAHSLLLRAHEYEPGSIAQAYEQGLALLRQAHTVRAMRRAEKAAHALLDAVPHDRLKRPRVTVVGEIYVMLTSFANRGTTEHLLGREGLEVVEGITLGKFIRHSLMEMRRRALCQLPPLRRIISFCRQRHISLFEQRLRDRRAVPFLVHEVGGEGVPTVGAAIKAVEAGCDGIIHLHPFKCMPEALAKDALKEIAELYNVRYLALSFDKETEIERLRTEVATYAAVLQAQVAQEQETAQAQRRKTALRRKLSQALQEAYLRQRRRQNSI